MNGRPQNTGTLILVAAILFGVFLSWFYFGSSWYPRAQLVISGTLAEVPADIGIRWDSGSGLNGYERYICRVQSLPSRDEAEQDGVSLVITRTGERNPASAGKNVILRTMLIDQQQYHFNRDELPPGLKLMRDGSVLFTEDGAELRVPVNPAHALYIELQSFNRAGKVDVRLGGHHSRYDLYASNQMRQWDGRNALVVSFWFVDDNGRFLITLPKPRYPITMFRLGSETEMTLDPLTIRMDNGRRWEVPGFAYRGGVNVPFSQIDEQLQQRFHPHRILWQVVFALLSAWVGTALFVYVQRFDGVRDMFCRKQRFLFWFMLFFSVACFAFWHVSFWPGVMSNDSLEIWRAAQIPGMYLGDHPPLNVLFYLFLSHVWNNPAIVPLVQNLLTSLLIAHIFFSLFRRGLPWFWLLPCYLLLAFSLPVGLYTMILWKDVPFALLTVFVAYRLASLYYDKRKDRLDITTHEWVVLTCLTLAIAGFRHNGVLSLVLVPAILVLFGIVRLRPVVVSMLLVVSFALTAYFVVAPGSFKSAAYLRSQTELYLDQALEKASSDYVVSTGRNYLGIFNVNQTRWQWDLVHLCMYGRYTFDFLKQLRWNDVYPYLRLPRHEPIEQMRRAAWALYWWSYEKPWVYVTWNPFYVLFVLPLLPLLYRRLPMTAVFSFGIIVPVAALVFLGIFNWRYYYFAHFASYFLVPLAVTDCYSFRKR